MGRTGDERSIGLTTATRTSPATNVTQMALKNFLNTLECELLSDVYFAVAINSASLARKPPLKFDQKQKVIR